MLSGLRLESLRHGRTVTVGTVLLKDGVATIDVERADLRAELEGGVIGPDRKRYIASDGELFLRAVLQQYRGTYLRARILREEAQ